MKEIELLKVRKIWSSGLHSAFTDLCYFQDHWYCVFREGQSHVSPDGKICILDSMDGETWEARSWFSSPSNELSDLRDPKLCLTPDGRLMLTATGVRHEEPVAHQSFAWFSADGRQWTAPLAIGEPNFWMWRITWHGGKAYSMSYRSDSIENEHDLRLYESNDGISFRPLVSKLPVENRPNESTLVFQNEDLLAIVRREAGPATALLGRSSLPYQHWEWKDLGVFLGGPNLIEIPDGRFIAGGRLHNGGAHMALCALNVENGKLQEILSLPSGGDSSYPGLVWWHDTLWVSYYSRHEGQCDIYLAQVRL